MRQVATSLPGLGAAPVYLCENPAVVAAAADALGARSAPLVGTSGVPNSAVVALVDALHRAGSRVVIHADFDWAGVRIVAAAVDRWEATPWRFGEADYRVASVRAAASLVGHAAPTPWDPPLADALMAAQVAVHEELVLEDLVGDLDGS